MHFSPGAIPSSEVIVKALVGGKFLFPDGMQPVSALYVILFAHEVLQPVKLEIQHCVCLKSSQQFKYLSFITAPIDESAPPYKFQYIEGGKFYTDSQYGMIVRSKFCLMGIGKKINGGGSHTPSDSEQDSTSDDDASNSEPQVISANGAHIKIREANNYSIIYYIQLSAGVQSIKKDMSHIDDVEAIESNQLVVQKPEEKCKYLFLLKHALSCMQLLLFWETRYIEKKYPALWCYWSMTPAHVLLRRHATPADHKKCKEITIS